ncbi:MAG: SPOR domain-containing protein, partial [Porticoccaceae bacterium]|nr:SPOR domain-containing protein [Porticoccaceae bacterium]
IILVVGLINVTGNRDNSGAVTIPAPPVDEAKQKAENAAKEKEAKEKAEREKIVLPPENTGPARFSFYEMLPETEIKPEPVEAYKSTPKDAKMKYNYLLQAGSFRAQSDAERMRAKLVMAGMPNATTTRTTGSNGVWYRVRIGPFDNRSLMNRAHDKLVRMQIQPMEIRLKQ